MKKLEEIKNEYALMMVYPNWDEFISDLPIYNREEHYDEISNLYATECVKASLEKVSEIMYEYNRDDNPQEASDLVCNPENIILL